MREVDEIGISSDRVRRPELIPNMSVRAGPSDVIELTVELSLAALLRSRVFGKLLKATRKRINDSLGREARNY